jgi:U3 small nucleolar RNA-associated protein 10
LEFDIFIYQKSEINSTGGDSLSEVFGLVFDESKKIPTEIADSNIWFSLDHPKVHVD